MFDFQILNKWASNKANEPAFIDEENVLNFAQLNSLTRKIATLLDNAGIGQRDLVCVALPTYLEWCTILALHLLGATSMSKSGTSGFNREVMPDWIISLQPDFEIPSNRTIIFDDNYLALAKASQEMLVTPGYSNPTDIARLFSTSGTSGATKYMAATAEELEELATSPNALELSGGEHPVLLLFPFNTKQSYRNALKCLTLGIPIYSCGFRDYRLAKVMHKRSIRTLMGSPAQIASFLDVLTQTGTVLPLLKTVITSGTAPSEKLSKRINEQLNCTIFNAYGSTEAGNVTIMKVDEDAPSGAIINASVNLQIVDDNDVEVLPNTVGRIRYSKPGMGHSYYKNASASAEFFKDGFFYPGDLGFKDRDGKLFLEGRSNDLINLGGVKLNPELIDRIAMAQLWVLDCASFAVKSESGIDQLAIALVTDGEFDLEYFGAAMRKKSPAMPTVFVARKSIPRNENGKIMRQTLRDEYGG